MLPTPANLVRAGACIGMEAVVLLGVVMSLFFRLKGWTGLWLSAGLSAQGTCGAGIAAELPARAASDFRGGSICYVRSLARSGIAWTGLILATGDSTLSNTARVTYLCGIKEETGLVTRQSVFMSPR